MLSFLSRKMSVVGVGRGFVFLPAVSVQSYTVTVAKTCSAIAAAPHFYSRPPRQSSLRCVCISWVSPGRSGQVITKRTKPPL